MRLKAGYAAGAAMMCAMLEPAHAQEAAGTSKDVASGGDIIVTARRSEERLQDVPISITVLTPDAIAKRNIYNAGDLGTYVPSLSTNANFGPEKSSFAIRGFIQEGRTSPSVGVYFADVVAPRANTGTTSGNGAGVGAFFDLQNIQVLKGPQGTLFGRNTTGGAILLVPTKPTDKLEGYVEGTLGNYNQRRLQAALNVPLSDTFRVRAAVDWNKADGYLNNISGIGPNRFGNTDYIAGRLSIVGDLTPDLENYIIFNYSRSHTTGSLAKAIACDPKTFGGLSDTLAALGCAQVAREQASGNYWTVENSDPHPREIQETWRAIDTTTWRATDTLTVKNIISYAEFREDSSFSLFGDNLTYPANYFFPGLPAGTFPTLTLESGATGEYAEQSTFTEEFQLQGRSADSRLTWQAGAYLEISRPLNFNSAYNIIFSACQNAGAFICSNNPFGFGYIFAANIKDFYNNKGLYAQATYKLTDQLSLTGGIRYTIDRMSDDTRDINIRVPTPGTATFACQNILKFNTGTVTNPIPVVASGPLGPECDEETRIESKKPTWLIDLDYKPSQDTLLYAKWARGYRQGSVIAVNIGFPTFEPETVDTYEVGAKTTFRGAVHGYLNLAGFYNNFRNQQLAANSVVSQAYLNLISPAQVIVNAGKSRIWGIEVDGSISPFRGLKIDVAYAYLNTKLLSFTPPPVPVFYSQLVSSAAVGDPLAQSPKNRVTVTATYTLPLDESIGRISFGGTLTHTDSNAVDQQSLEPNTYRVQAIDLLNLNAGWDSPLGMPVDVSFFMTNATNQKRMIYPIATAPTIGSEYGYLNQPRMWGFRLRYRFGS